MINIKPDMLVDMKDVLGDLAYEYNLPYLRFDELVLLGKCAVNVYGLEDRSKRITFAELCECISKYVESPFGNKVLRQILAGKRK